MNPKKSPKSFSFFVLGGDVMACIRPLANGNFCTDVRMKGIVKNKTFPSEKPARQFIAHWTQSATGVSNSQKHVNPNVMMRFLQPFNSEIAGLFGQIVDPVLKKLIVNQHENTKLALLRDWLLPMLMNGQVTVKQSTD